MADSASPNPDPAAPATGAPEPGANPAPGSGPAPGDGLLLCNRVMRGATAVILGAFLLIVALTTVSTAASVQVAGKALYYLILVGAVTSLVTWVVRVRLEKRAGSGAS